MIKLLAIILILISSLSLAQKKQNTKISVIERAARIDVNNLDMLVSNIGILGYYYVPDSSFKSGLFFPKGQTEKGLLEASGILLGAKDASTNELLTSTAFYSSVFAPGEIRTVGHADYTDEKYRVYKISKGDGNENPDFAEFPCELGAPCNFDGTPEMLGDQMLWCVYNDYNPNIETNNSSTETPLGIEIRQTVFAFDTTGVLGNTIFFKFQFSNKGNSNLKDFYFSLQHESRIGQTLSDDFIGCNPDLGLAFAYNSDNSDEYYSEIPALGYKMLQNPIITSFVELISSHSSELYNYMQGNYSNGTPYINSVTGDTTKFWYSGNPITFTGDIQEYRHSRYGAMFSSGGFEMAPGDSQEIIFALTVGQCENNLLSLGEVFSNSKEIQRFFDNNYSFLEPPKQPEVSYEIGDGKITLDWFASKEKVENSFNAEKYSFEGYSIYQGETENGPWKLSKRFDIANGISNIKNSTFNEEICFEETRTWLSPDLGLEHSYEITEDVFKYEPLKNWKEYYFAVSSYAVRTDEYSSVLESPKTVLKLAPQSQEITSEELDKITPVPNPYYGRSEYENGDEVVIRFVNLPDTKKTTIRIFNLSGNLVTTLKKEANTGNRFLDWNGQNKNGRKCSSGVYIYQTEIEGLGKKTGKMICAFRR